MCVTSAQFNNDQAVMAQSVAHLIGSEEVTGSIPVNSFRSIDFKGFLGLLRLIFLYKKRTHKRIIISLLFSQKIDTAIWVSYVKSYCLVTVT